MQLQLSPRKVRVKIAVMLAASIAQDLESVRRALVENGYEDDLEERVGNLVTKWVGAAKSQMNQTDK
ncbi:hypothetical protein [Sinimarinibacterium flocculans]|uniref:Uncharacterized protein n=1 Tax=Sinimarinibacterium flocculans TaxID=985250 RepID=A0A318EFJ9_9GAMM|nr:hypothetical protein [Sinimarinibacterium flocculans]PXV71557.1 hypothetical protein C8D93_101609 [Sinimarinibacterium flocculans]